MMMNKPKPKSQTSVFDWITNPQFCTRVAEGQGDSDERLVRAFVTWKFSNATPDRLADELAVSLSWLRRAWPTGGSGLFRLNRTVSEWCNEFGTPAGNGEPSPAGNVARAYLAFHEMPDSQDAILGVIDSMLIAGFCFNRDQQGASTITLRSDTPRLPIFQPPLWLKTTRRGIPRHL